MDKDSDPCSRPAGRRRRGEVVRAYQGMAHQRIQWTWEEKVKPLTTGQPFKHEAEWAGESLGATASISSLWGGK